MPTSSGPRPPRSARALFNDKRLARTARSLAPAATPPSKQFQDGRQFGKGVGTGKRRTMPVMGAAHSPFLFWDGRKDSLWSQALGPAGRRRGARRQPRALRQACAGPVQGRSTRQCSARARPWQAARRRIARTARKPSGPPGPPLPGHARRRQSRVRQHGQGHRCLRAEHLLRRVALRPVRPGDRLAADGRGQEVLTPQEVRGCALSSPRANAPPATTGRC